jgi:hypothetical protein
LGHEALRNDQTEAVKKEIYLKSDAGAFHLISFQQTDGHFS